MFKKIFFSGLFLLSMQLLQGMDAPDIESLCLRDDFKENSNKQHLANMLQAQGIDLYPHSSSICCGTTIFAKESLGFAWQPNGNACGSVTIEEECTVKDYKNSKRKILLERYCIENKELKSYKKKWSNICLKGYDYTPFFDEKGNFSFYTGGIVDQKRQLFGYTISADGQATAYPCILSYKKGISRVTTPLSILKNEPFLLQDILRSPSNLTVATDGESVRVFKVEDILFSDEYTNRAVQKKFWFFDWILHRVWSPVKKTDALYEEVFIPCEQKEEVFDAEKYFADKKDFVQAEDENRDIRRALKMAMWYQCLYEKINKIILYQESCNEKYDSE